MAGLEPKHQYWFWGSYVLLPIKFIERLACNIASIIIITAYIIIMPCMGRNMEESKNDWNYQLDCIASSLFNILYNCHDNCKYLCHNPWVGLHSNQIIK